MTRTIEEWLDELGGVARRGTLLRLVDRVDLDDAVESGLVVRRGRGLYTLPAVAAAIRVPAELGGVLSMTSAALHHGWGVKTQPTKPHVTVSRGRKLGERAAIAVVHRAELAKSDVVGGVTSEQRTLLDCLRHLPHDEALAVADSALRESGCHDLLRRVADSARGRAARRSARLLLKQVVWPPTRSSR